MWPATHAHQIHLSPKLRLDDGQRYDAGMTRGIGGHEAKAKPGCDHRQGPVLAIAPIGRFHGHALIVKNAIGVTCKFAIVSMDVRFAIEVLDCDCPLIGKTMARMDDDYHLLLEKR